MSFVNLKKTSKETREIAGRTVDVILTPRGAPSRGPIGFVTNIFKSLISLMKGLKVTFHYFARPSTVTTQQYPENRETLKMFDRFRAQLRLKYDADGLMSCTACGICEGACPNKSIYIIEKKGDASGKRELDRFVWRFDTCTFCNACVVACPFNSIEMSGDFESAVYDRRLLVYNLNKYKGPFAKLYKKIEDPEKQKASIEPNEPYEGDLPLTGTKFPGIPALEGERK
ncbi:4Fe-4S binding protein [Bdellovibrionota bacterium]